MDSHAKKENSLYYYRAGDDLPVLDTADHKDKISKNSCGGVSSYSVHRLRHDPGGRTRIISFNARDHTIAIVTCNCIAEGETNALSRRHRDFRSKRASSGFFLFLRLVEIMNLQLVVQHCH